MKINCAVVDDSRSDLKLIQNALHDISYGTDLLVITHLYQKPSDLPLDDHYSLYILDIDMPEINGFELAGRIYAVNHRAAVIFCTMHENFVFDSFKMNAFYFVRKENLESDLQYALKKYMNLLPGNTDSYIWKNAGKAEKIPMSDILYFEIVHNDLYIHLADGSEKIERKTLQAVYDELNQSSVIYLKRAFIINLSHIRKISDGCIWLSDDLKLPVPKSQYNEVRTQFLAYAAR